MSATLTSIDARTGRPRDVVLPESTTQDVTAAVERARSAFDELRGLPAERLALLLRTVADELELLGDELLEVADLETALGPERIGSERGRTTGQLRGFADLLVDGRQLEATIDTRRPDRPDLRRMLVPIGPVAVFAASNFPLAFSVPGGDTASALAAGCPVVVKASPSHPETSELCGRAIRTAVERTGLPAGTFSLVRGAGHEIGMALVTAPGIKAVGFTGSLRGGRALFDAAAGREEPIPVYAEMGSINPLFVSPGAAAARGAEIAAGFLASMTQGSGQFCTKPGAVFVVASEADAFVAEVARLARDKRVGPMLNLGMREALAGAVAEIVAQTGVELLAGELPQHEDGGLDVAATVVAVDADAFRSTPLLQEEHFGAVGVIVRCRDVAELTAIAAELPGTLTATVHAEAHEAPQVAALVEALEHKAGRLIWNGYPTGVAVAHAMHHGGPWPATTFPAHTSVGSAAIERFLRPVTFQDYPAALLPPALRDENPLRLARLVDGEMTTGEVSA
jgi:alpha-ketoglutaric semialdehyde dehydrogenase